MKNGIILSISLVLVFVLGFTALPARASWPPLQDASYTLNGDTINYIVSGHPGSWTIPKGPDPNNPYTFRTFHFVKCEGGIVAWVAGYFVPGGSGWEKFEIHYRVYDPGRGGWQADSSTFNEGTQTLVWNTNGNNTYFNVHDGVVTWLTEDQLEMNGPTYRIHRLHFCTYDAGHGKWKEAIRTYIFNLDQNGVGDLRVKDGVVAWSYGGTSDASADFWKVFLGAGSIVVSMFTGNVAGVVIGGVELGYYLAGLPDQSQKKVFFSIYDPGRPTPDWVSGEYAPTLYTTINIGDFGTVNISDYDYSTDPPTPIVVSRGYDPDLAVWYEGITKPKAYFVAQPSAGKAPLGVQFWDMSIGAGNWIWRWDFGAGSTTLSSTNDRSPSYTFGSDGAYWAKLQLSCILSDGTTYCSGQTANILVDSTPPQGGIRIKGGALTTNSPGVILELNASDNNLTEMCLGNDLGNGVAFGPWEPYQSTRWYVLPSNDGLKTVYVKYRDVIGNVSATSSASITLDTTPPQGAMVINGGSSTTDSPNVTVWLGAADALAGVSYMRVWESTNPPPSLLSFWEPYDQTQLGVIKSLTLSAGIGAKTVYAQFLDAAGNISSTISASITLTTSIPGSNFLSLTINGGAPYVRYVPPNVNEHIGGVDLQIQGVTRVSGGYITQMQLGNVNPANQFGGVDWQPWETFQNIKHNWALYTTGPEPLLVYTVKAKFKDNLGNIYGPVSASIRIDKAAPTDGTLTGTPLKTLIALNWSGFSDSGSGVQAYQLYGSPFGFPDPNSGVKLYEGLNTQFIHTSLTRGKTYYYRLCAVDKVGNRSAGATATVTTKGTALPFLQLLLD
jgi:hypothetical protein